MGSLVQFVKGMDQEFRDRNEYGLNFDSELSFAIQRINANSFLGKVAKDNAESLKAAIMNVASIGITLSPAEQLAYLVPREGKVALELSYRGLVKLAVDSGAILWAKPETVYVGDHFVWNGFAHPPEHQFDPFDSDRMNLDDPFENLRGGYCTAKLSDGSFLIDRMTVAEILKVRESSKANNGPWLARYKDRRGNEHRGWPEEMIKKTLIKRAHKSWPAASRLADAIEIDNQHNGLTIDQEPAVEPVTEERDQYMEEVIAQCKRTSITLDKLCQIAGKKTMDEIETRRLPRVIEYLKSQQTVHAPNKEEAA